MFKVLVFALCLVPFGYSCLQVYLLQTGGSHSLGADPALNLVQMQGEWTIWLLLATLAVTPVRKLLNWNRIQRVRRMLGLFTFFYASLHLLAYSVFLLELDLGNLASEVGKRPFILVGTLAWLLLVPLAATSTQFAMRALKGRWVTLHRLVYAVALLAVVHVAWQVRASYMDLLIYGGGVTLLLFYRVFETRILIFRKGIRGRVEIP